MYRTVYYVIKIFEIRERVILTFVPKCNIKTYAFAWSYLFSNVCRTSIRDICCENVNCYEIIFLKQLLGSNNVIMTITNKYSMWYIYGLKTFSWNRLLRILWAVVEMICWLQVSYNTSLFYNSVRKSQKYFSLRVLQQGNF